MSVSLFNFAMSEKYSAGSKADFNPFDDKNEYQYNLGRIESSESGYVSNVIGDTRGSIGTTSPRASSKKAKGSLAMFLKTKDIPFLTIATALICVTSVASPLQSILFGQAFEKLTLLYSGGYTSFHGFISDVRLLCGKIIIVGAVKMVFTWSGIFSWMKFGESQQTRARKQLFRRLLSKDSDWYDTKDNLMGDITQTNRCIEELRAGTSEVVGLLVQTIASVIALFVTAMVHSWLLTIVILAGSPLLALSGWYFGKLTCNAAKLENEASAQASKVLNWTLVASSSVRVSGGKYAEMVRFNKIVDTSAKAYFKVANAIAANGACLKTLVLMMFVQGFWFGNHLIKIGRLEINQVFTCFSSCLLLGTEISNLNHILAILNKAHAAAENIANMTVDSPSNASSPRLVDPTKCVGDIRLQDVHFKYSTRDEFTLKGVSFNIKPQKMNFIIGESGSGKSTISQLLMKYYSVSSGSISVDGAEIEAINPAWLTNNFTLVDQSPFIFNDTLKNNSGVAVVNKFTSLNDVPEPLLSDACTFALLDDAISVLDKGWDTPIVQNKLSGGQNQRIALARAKLRDTPILILDEALSALDTYNSDQIFESIRNWRHGRTTIVITHTLRQIRSSDYVVVMDNGTVKNQGYFAELTHEPVFESLNGKTSGVNEYGEFVTSTEESDDDHSLDYLKNPAILQDLEANAGKASGKICDSSKDGCEKIMPVLSILKYCSATITKKPLIGCGVLAALLEGVGGPVFSFTFAKLLNNMVNTAIGKDVGSALIKWSCTVIGISFGIGITRYLSLFLLAFASENWIVNLRKLAFVKINEQDMSFFDTGKTPAELTTLIMNDTRDLRSLVAEFLSLSINLVSLVLVGIVWSIVAGWKLALTGIAFVPLILTITGIYGKVLASSEARYKAQVVEIETLQHETVTNIKAVVGMDLKAFFSERFCTHLSTLGKLSTTRAIYTGFGLALSEVCISAATGTILYYGMSLAGRHEYSSDKLLQVITLLTFTMSSASSLIEQLPEISRGQRAGTLVIKLLSLESSPVETEGQLTLQKLSSDPVVNFNKTNFSYQQGSGKLALKNVTFSVSKNKIFGILGESGSGKSTIGSILARLYRVDPGSVQIFGQELNDFDVDWLREKLTLVSQHPRFFEGTLRDNLVYGLVNKSMTDGDIYDALKLVNMHSFVVSLPEGLYSRLGEGSNCMLSDGQLQRLSIAQGLIRKPEILILDECTSNLDPENTRIIIDLIRNNLRGKLTILIITHEPQLMKVTDSLIVLKDGKVVEHGTYSSLSGANTELSRITNRMYN